MGMPVLATLEPSQGTVFYGLGMPVGSEIIVVADYTETQPYVVQAT